MFLNELEEIKLNELEKIKLYELEEIKLSFLPFSTNLFVVKSFKSGFGN